MTTSARPRPRRPHGAHVLIVDDDERVRAVLTNGLQAQGFRVSTLAWGHLVAEAMRGDPPDLVLLDIVLPDTDGLTLLRELRVSSTVPVILLSERGQEVDRILGLELGADDYVTKPFSTREVATRIKAVLRRAVGVEPAPPATATVHGPLRIDPLSQEVHLAGDLVQLTPMEFSLLQFLAAAPRQVFTRAQLLQQVWESSPEWQSLETVTEHVRRLRRKLDAVPAEHRWIATVRGVGYRFEPPPPAR